MKLTRWVLAAALLSLSTMALAQMEKDQKDGAKSEATKSFEQIKTLAGTWEGHVTTVPPMPEMGKDGLTRVSMRVTSKGNSLVHEMKDPRAGDDPMKADHPVTMFYVDSDRLVLTHYCDAGNRPRMAAHASADGKTLDFDFLDVAGSTQYGHMQHAAFTVVDADHHIEEWTYMMPGDKPIRARMEMQRIKDKNAF